MMMTHTESNFVFDQGYCADIGFGGTARRDGKLKVWSPSIVTECEVNTNLDRTHVLVYVYDLKEKKQG